MESYFFGFGSVLSEFGPFFKHWVLAVTQRIWILTDRICQLTILDEYLWNFNSPSFLFAGLDATPSTKEDFDQYRQQNKPIPNEADCIFNFSCAKKQCCGSRIPDPNFSIPYFGSASKNLSILTQEMVSKLSEMWFGLFIPDPDPDFLPMPDPGSGSSILNKFYC